MSHDHSHAIPTGDNKKYLWIAFVLTSTYLVVEVIGGLVTGSLALLSDAAHMLTDASALAISLTAVHLASRPANPRKTFGYHRFEILAAAFNAIMLFFVAIYVLYEAYQRFSAPADIQTTGMFVIAAIGLLINLISMRLLVSGKDQSLNIKSAYLEVWSDMLGSVGVLLGALIIHWTGYAWVDSVIAIAIGLWVLPRTWLLLKETTNILLEGVPEGMDIEEIQAEMCNIPGILSVHDFHLWALTSGKPSLTAHVVYDSTYDHSEHLLPLLQEMLAQKFAIYHTTFQFENRPCEHTNRGCNYTEPSAG
ncbi:cation diffusion facilitator family transporter [Legionella spiritensis]|uniref:Cation efflux system protein n=1 Tax=Legionella spiritensis TaxID=452 RepID=A0A0W0Z469_LEGSP|nr:cation diffusion facilitator family transporter [Legionella spiritensis]KTD63916.1 cation efflux system protein [Legionella spiritensis]SNV36507.1 cation efflux system protein, CDF family [Legionella spiritensis]